MDVILFVMEKATMKYGIHRLQAGILQLMGESKKEQVQMKQ